MKKTLPLQSDQHENGHEKINSINFPCNYGTLDPAEWLHSGLSSNPAHGYLPNGQDANSCAVRYPTGHVNPAG